MKDRIYQGVQLSKKESELMQFLHTGSNDFTRAFYIWENRKKKLRDSKVIQSWFNRTLKSLKNKGLVRNIPFVYSSIRWLNPGIEASKANLVIEEKVQAFQESRASKKMI